jgi:serine/threonine protein kinase
VLARLRHPCLCSFYGLVNVHGSIGVVYELMVGGSLATLLLERRPGCVEAPVAARIARDVAVGLAYLHHSGIAHRDVKAANVMLTEGLRAKLADFGLSSPDPPAGQAAGHVAPAVGAAPAYAGAPTYMAPELISRGNDELTEPCRKRNDVFSYGVLLFELMAPEPYITPASVPKRAPFSTDWRPGLKLASGLEPFEPLISWAWDEEPRRRPTMDELVAPIGQTGLAPPCLPAPGGLGTVEGGREKDASRRLSEALWGCPDDP